MTLKTVAHLALDGDTSGYFPQLGKSYDRSKYRMLFVTLREMEPSLRASLEASGVQCFSCVAHSRFGYPLAMLRLARLLRREHVDIVHAHLFDPSVVGLLTAWLMRTPVRVMTRHYSDYHTRIHKKWHVRLDRLCTALSHRVIAVSQHTKDHMLSEENAPADKVRVVLNGIDFTRVRTSGPDVRESLRREFGIADGFLLLIVARLHPEKGHTYLFSALAELRKRLPKPFKLVVAGKGTYDQQYRDEVRALGVDDVVHFAGFRTDVADLIAAADVMILPSVAEAFGLVLCEAMFLGTPVVATRVGGIPELIEDGVDGLLVPAADSGALAGAIAKVLNDTETRERIRGTGREKVTRRFRFDRMLRDYEAVYEELAR